MSDTPLRVPEAARRLGVPTKELLRLMHDGEVAYPMQDGIPHVPTAAIDVYRAKAS